MRWLPPSICCSRGSDSLSRRLRVFSLACVDAARDRVCELQRLRLGGMFGCTVARIASRCWSARAMADLRYAVVHHGVVRAVRQIRMSAATLCTAGPIFALSLVTLNRARTLGAVPGTGSARGRRSERYDLHLPRGTAQTASDSRPSFARLAARDSGSGVRRPLRPPSNAPSAPPAWADCAHRPAPPPGGRRRVRPPRTAHTRR